MKKFISIAALIVLSGCAGQQQAEIASSAINKAQIDCPDASFKKKLAKISCMEKSFDSFYTSIGQPVPNDFMMMTAKAKVLAEKLDKKQITQAEYEFEIKEYGQQMDAAARADQQMRYQNYLAYQRNLNMVRPRNCTSNNIGGTIHTNCY